MTDRYAQPQTVTDVQMAFPALLDSLLPPMSVIPDDYPNKADWLEFQRRWFFEGLPADAEVWAVRGVSAEAAFRHLRCIQGSFEPKHEHKEAAVAWLASRWFRRVVSAGAGFNYGEKEVIEVLRIDSEQAAAEGKGAKQ